MCKKNFWNLNEEPENWVLIKKKESIKSKLKNLDFFYEKYFYQYKVKKDEKRN